MHIGLRILGVWFVPYRGPCQSVTEKSLLDNCHPRWLSRNRSGVGLEQGADPRGRKSPRRLRGSLNRYGSPRGRAARERGDRDPRLGPDQVFGARARVEIAVGVLMGLGGARGAVSPGLGGHHMGAPVPTVAETILALGPERPERPPR
jgi:hypothetical protein